MKIGAEAFTEWENAFNDLHPTVKIYTERYVDTAKYWSSEPSIPFNKIKSKILLKPLSRHVIHQIVDFLDFLKNEKKPNVRLFFNFDAFGGVVPDFHTAFPFRDAFGWWYLAMYWPLQQQNAEAIKLITQIYNETSPFISKYSYSNSVDYALGRGYLKAYYAGNVDRLIDIKAKYDPENIFHWRQSIPLCR